jgi:cyanophycin synthetase
LVALRRAVAHDKRRHKGLVRLAQAAEQRELSLFSDDDCTSIGMGRHSLSLATRALPDLASIDFGRVADIPVALVTGTNGKSTSVRLLGSMVAAAGLTAGLSSTDWVRVGDQVLEHGDYSGPSGARMVLRDQRVDVALLEFARGGIARRGINVRRARVALITNVGADHLGEWGVSDLNALADVKFTLARAVQHGGALVLNADDELLVRRAKRAGAVRLAWFSRDSKNPIVLAHLERGGAAAFLEQGALWYARGSVRLRVAPVEELSFLFGGAAAHNVSNALGAIATAFELGLEAQAVATGLARFSSDSVDNPGRLNSFEFGGLRVLCDFAHNPHGMQALLSMIAALPAQRRLLVLGQAGDRDDASIRELARLSAAANPDRIVVKEMPQHLRGRQAGAVVALITDELQRCSYPMERTSLAQDERDAVLQALQWAKAGDLLLLLLHAEREYVLQWMQRLCSAGWQPGEPIPG